MQCLLVAVLLGTVLEQTLGCGYDPCHAITSAADYTQIIVDMEGNCENTCSNRVCCLGYKIFGEAKCFLVRNVTAPGLEFKAGDETGFSIVRAHHRRVCPTVKIGFSASDPNAADIKYFPTEADVVKPAFIGNGADLTGRSDYVTLKPSLTAGPPLNCVDLAQGCSGLTIAFWARISVTRGDFNYLLHGYGMRFIQYHTNKLTAYMFRYISATQGERTSITYNGFTQIDQWAHLALVLTIGDGTLKMYVNGEEVGSGVPQAPQAAKLSATFKELFIGTSSVKSSRHNLVGSVDEFMIYDEALTPLEMKHLWMSYL